MAKCTAWFWSSILLFMICIKIGVAVDIKVFDVTQYGGHGDGKTDNTQAFLSAWKDACEWNGRGRFYIPQGIFMVGEVKFLGPCKGSIVFTIMGNVKAPQDPFAIKGDTWIQFRYVDNLFINGGGILDGQGQYAWPHNDCDKNPNCHTFATTISFQFVKHSIVLDLTSINSKNTHFNVFACENVNMSNLVISAPDNSPNTDGIKIGASKGINISYAQIKTGDDCVSMLSGNSDIYISQVSCGPGHGISIGSLGKNPHDKNVERITIENCIISDTKDGLRIKTWSDATSSIVVSDITYDKIIMNNVGTPINIDQQYCPYPPCNLDSSSSVQIKDVTFSNINGSITSNTPYNLNCSKRYPCQNIVFQNIKFTSQGATNSYCKNVNGHCNGNIDPQSCFC